MTNVSDVVAHPPLVLSPTTTVYTGTVRLGSGGVAVVVRGQQSGQQFGFFLPETTPLAEGAATPTLRAEAYLTSLVMVGAPGARFDLGVDQVVASYQPDPRGGSARWLHLSGVVSAPLQLQLGYRVTVQTAGEPAPTS
jgi:hypothetical protein